MSDGAYRDDHEAAVARAAALDRELAQARAERDAARDQCDALRDRLARATRTPPPQVILPRRGSPASVAGAVSVATIGLIAAAVATNRTKSPMPRFHAVPITMPAPLRLVPAAAAQVADCIGAARGIAADDLPSMPPFRDCEHAIEVAVNDVRLAELVRGQLHDLDSALIDWTLVASARGGEGASLVAQATANVRAAAGHVDLLLLNEAY